MASTNSNPIRRFFLMCTSLLIPFILIMMTGCSTKVVDISGEWRFAVDPEDSGIESQWFNTTLADRITLPGSMLTNGKGNAIDLDTPWTGLINDRSFFDNEEYAAYREPDNFKIPMWLQPDLYYKGVAWYQKDINIPAGWKGTTVRLYFERCHWQTSVWLDGEFAGYADALGTPQTFDLTELASPGRHTLTVRIDNDIHEIDPGLNAHSISDHTQGNWNGIIGDMHIESLPAITVSRIDVYPSLSGNSFSVKARVNSSRECKSKLTLKLNGESFSLPCSLNEGSNELEGSFVLRKKVSAWSESHPVLYDLTYKMAGSGDSKSMRIGFREIGTENGRLLLNGEPLFLRGTLHCGAFPLTGYPSTDKEEWLREFRICREYGLNHIRFHSWCPPEAAFEAADELGMYLQVECSVWPNTTTTLGEGKPVDKYTKEEAERIVETFGNHPSFCMMAAGNEPGGKCNKYLAEFVNYWKSADPRRIYTTTAGWPILPESDFHCALKPRIQGWKQGLGSIINSKEPSTTYDWRDYTSRFNQPVVSHEIGQWCVYPNFKEIARYTGPYKARNFEIFMDRLEEHGLEDMAEDFLYASGRLQTLCYKADIEAALRTPGFGGFQLLGINDFPGQGTALVGALDAFWEDKGYTSGEEYRRFCSDLVPLARMSKLIYLSDETLHADIELANFSEKIASAPVTWRLADASGRTIRDGALNVTDIPLGNCIDITSIDVDLNDIPAPARVNLEVSVNGHSNDWNIWVYPTENKKAIEDVVLTDDYSTAMDCLKEGKKVILSYKKGTVTDELGGDIEVGFSSIFWNTAWTRGQAPHTLGILCDPSHKALASFPTEAYSDYQWYDAMSHSQAIRMEKYPVSLEPVVRIIDDWFTAEPLCLVGEVRNPESGRMIVTGIDFFDDLDNRPAARQLLYSLMDYLTE